MKFYYCDPTLNEACPKTFCQGECRLTTREEYAVTDEFKKPLIVYIDNVAHELISVSKGCLKTRTGRFVVYDVGYLKSHIEQEAAIYGNVSAIEALKKSKWIPCSERLPEDGDTYLVTIEYNGEVIGVDAASYSPVEGYIDNHWDTFNDWKEDDDSCYHVTAWMPLPQPYKAESEDKE